MSLHNKSRRELESCTPALEDSDEVAALVRCLDSYSVWALRSDVSLTPHLWNDGYWESWVTSWFTHNIVEGDFVLDIGANCGYYTMLFERLVGPNGVVIAYEPASQYAELLELTRIANDAQFKIENMALSDKEGHLSLVYPGNYNGSATVTNNPFDARWGDEHYETVWSSTLDKEFESRPTPDLIKMDAEGAEEMIWSGGQNLLSLDAPMTIVLEYTPGAYSEHFGDRLAAWGSLGVITHEGTEVPIQREHLDGLTDLEMIVVRNYK